MLKSILKAKNIHKSYANNPPVEVLKGVDLNILPSSSIAIMGASGEGKTTLLHILATLETADQGQIFYNNQPIQNKTKDQLRRRHFGFVFQSYNLFDDLSVLDNLLVCAKIARKNTHKKSDAYQRALDLLEAVQLVDKFNCHTKVLSGGEKQRVAIARALFHQPQIIFADEPTGNLDHHTSLIIHNLLFECVKKYSHTLVIATHDQQLANLCEKKYLLEEGSIKSID